MSLGPHTPRQRTLTFLFGLLIFAAGFVGGGLLQQHRSGKAPSLASVFQPVDVVNRTKGQPLDTDFSLFWDVWSRVNQSFDGTPEPAERLYGAIQGELASLGDPYTMFFDPKASKEFAKDLDGELSGIGAEIERQGQNMVVVAPLPDSPAAKSGLKPKDILYKIDGQTVDINKFNQNIVSIRGQAGTSVKLSIIRPPSEKPLEFAITRENIHVASLSWQIRPDGLAVAKMRQFSTDTAGLMKKMADELTAKHTKGLVLDLRSNPGGYLDASQSVWGILSNQNPLVIEKNKRGQNDNLDGTGEAVLNSLPLALLVDSGSASASEILAGAVQDHGRGKVIGEKTYGKGSVQNLINLPGGSSLKVTTAHWFTPEGRQIDQAGITPDIIVPTPENGISDHDPQLDKAIETLKGSR